MTRRDFSRRAFAVTAANALSASRIWGANDRIRMGLIGSGGRGREDWGNFLKETDVDPVAVCDVYEPFREQGIVMTKGRAKPFRCEGLLAQKDVQPSVGPDVTPSKRKIHKMGIADGFGFPDVEPYSVGVHWPEVELTLPQAVPLATL